MTETNQEVQVVAPSSETTPPAAPQEKMSEEDRLTLELAKTKREAGLSASREYLAKAEMADLQYRHLVLQIYMKYNLTAADAIKEDGTIMRGGAHLAQQNQGQ